MGLLRPAGCDGGYCHGPRNLLPDATMVLKHLLGLAFLTTLLFAACGEDGDGGTDGASDGRNGTPSIGAPSEMPTPDETRPGAGLGAGEEGEACAEVITPGYEVVLRLGETQYTYRTDQTGTNARFGGV